MSEPRVNIETAGHANGVACEARTAFPAARAARLAERGAGRPAVFRQLIRPRALQAMLMRPAYLAQSAWLEHVPFAFWLVEAQRPRTIVELGTHYGVSYFAFCQAVERLGLDTRCFAVDHWQGDAHAGFFGEEVFERVRAYNDAQYSGFSRLVRSDFDDALAHFSDAGIDLLHIDGLHTLESVRHDFEAWLPKLSERGVVVLHDSNVRERGFGVFRLVESLRREYPCFEFAHGHGLAVVGVGRKPPGQLRALFEASRDGAAHRALGEMFARLGRAAADAHAAAALEKRAESARAEAETARADLSRQAEALGIAEAERDSAREDAAAARAQAAALQDSVAAGEEALRAAQASLAAEQEAAARAGAEARAAREELSRERRAAEAAGRAAAAERAAAETARAEAEAAQAERVRRAARLREVEAELAELRRAADAARDEAETERTARAAAETALEEAQRAGADAAERHRRAHDAQAARVRTLEAERDDARARADGLAAKLDQRGGELAEVTRMLEDADARAEQLSGDLARAVRSRGAALRLVGRAVTALGGYAPEKPPRRGVLRRLAARLRAAGVFDDAWYLARNDDVREPGLDAAEHYLLHGVTEGRPPCDLSRVATAERAGEGAA